MKRQYLSTDEIHAELLSILQAFASFCDSHHLRYVLIGGSMLGAVRHKGFIPWDDDIDVGMPRPDYEKLRTLEQLFYEETGYRLSGYRSLKLKDSPMVKVVDENIDCLEMGTVPVKLWIDLVPVDGLPANDTLNRLICESAFVARRILSIMLTPPNERSGSVGTFVKKNIIHPVISVIPSIAVAQSKLLSAISQSVSFGSSQYAGIVSFGVYRSAERIPLEGWTKRVLVEFENSRYSGISCWDQYLRQLYGDYMKLPPENKRETHGLKAWRVEVP
ncbi:MAG: LicD family protein [Actinomycetaceae bacterium]|nr:LicD family protein [Actinomycetaceae bacterium]